MDDLNIINNAIAIKETIGFKILDDIDEVDHPNVIRFAIIAYNYMKMKQIDDSKETN